MNKNTQSQKGAIFRSKRGQQQMPGSQWNYGQKL